MRLPKILIDTVHSKKGETLVEIIISLFLLAVLFSGITVMLMASSGINRAAIAHAEAQQEEINGVILFDDIMSDEKAVTTVVSFTSSDFSLGISAEHEVLFVNENGVITFYPIVSEVTLP
jgi:hypothetical protein